MSLTGTRPVTLLICDDHRVLTDALAMVVGSDDSLTLAGPPLPDPRAAIASVERTHPDVVLMDVVFRGTDMNGIEATRRIKQCSPETNVVIMTAHEDDYLLLEAVEAGAAGFLPKSEAVEGLLKAVRGAADGEVLVDPATLSRILKRVGHERRERDQASALLATLTARECETVQLLAQGKRTADIAEQLEISPQTVQTHVRNILKKLGVHSKLEAVAFAVKHGAIQV